MKIIMCEMKNILNEMNDRLNITEEMIYTFKDITI